MKHLLTFLRGSHKPDASALSALADGRLDPASARALEAHIATCAACTGRVGELQRVKATLAAMPQADAPHSFRLRRADVEAPARPAPAAGSGLLRAMPVLSGVAAVAFALVLATDFSTREAGDGPTAASRDTASGAPAEALEAFRTSKSAEAPAGATAADSDGEATEPGAPGSDTRVEDGAAGEDAAAPEPSGEPTSPADGAFQYNPLSRMDYAQTQVADDYEAASARSADDDDGGRTAFLVVEIIAAGVAIAAGAAFAVSRRNRRVQS